MADDGINLIGAPRRITHQDLIAGKASVNAYRQQQNAILDPDEIHYPSLYGPIEAITIRYRRDADGTARDVDPEWGRQIAAAALRIAQQRNAPSLSVSVPVTQPAAGRRTLWAWLRRRRPARVTIEVSVSDNGEALKKAMREIAAQGLLDPPTGARR
jgi:hypothetical protein